MVVIEVDGVKDVECGNTFTSEREQNMCPACGGEVNGLKVLYIGEKFSKGTVLIRVKDFRDYNKKAIVVNGVTLYKVWNFKYYEGYAGKLFLPKRFIKITETGEGDYAIAMPEWLYSKVIEDDRIKWRIIK